MTVPHVEVVRGWRAGAGTLLVLNAMDLTLTYLALSWGASEGNPLAVWLIESYLAVPVKLGLAGFAVWLSLRRPSRATVLTVAAVWAACGVYALVVVLNLITVIEAAG